MDTTEETSIKQLGSEYTKEVWFVDEQAGSSQTDLRVGENLFSNPLVVPRFVSAEFWKEIVAKMFCEAHNLDSRRLHNLLASQIDIVYREHKLYDSNRPFGGNMLYVYDKFHTRYRKTGHLPALKEAILFQALLDPLANPELKKSYCSGEPNDEREILFTKRKRTVVAGQKYLSAYNTWLFLLSLNKLFEYRRRRDARGSLLVVMDESLVTTQAKKTIDFVASKQEEARMTLIVTKNAVDLLGRKKGTRKV